MIEDVELNDLVIEIDNLLFNFVEKHELSFLDLTAIILARLSHVSYDLGNKEDFAKLLDTAKYTVLNESPLSNISNNSTAIH
jgi:hypothetical protein